MRRNEDSLGVAARLPVLLYNNNNIVVQTLWLTRAMKCHDGVLPRTGLTALLVSGQNTRVQAV